MRAFLLLLWLGFFGVLQAAQFVTEVPQTVMPFSTHDDEDAPAAEASQARHVYTTLQTKPDRIFKGEIFSVTLRSIVTTDHFDALTYRFSSGSGVKLLSDKPERTLRDHAYYDRFFFKSTAELAFLPDITPVLSFGFADEEISNTIIGSQIDVTVLNPPGDFCGVLAERLEITHAKTTAYDKEHNIIVFSADANRSDLGDFRIPSAGKQNFESLHSDPYLSKMSYYAVLPASAENLHFQYFNLQKKSYERITIPIKVDSDLVSTTSDINPTEHGHNVQKAIAFGSVAALLLLLALWRRSWTLLAVAVVSGGYAAWINIPLQQVCVKEGASIYLLPMRNATVFEIAPRRYQLEKQGHIDTYTKVRLLNDKIGWVKDEDICTY
jgi:hypothetical protein